MKILLVNDVGAPHGGAEKLTYALQTGLRNQGHEARVFASSAPSESGPNQADYSCFGTVSSLRTLNRVVNLSAHRQLGHALRSFSPDIVHLRMFLSQLSPVILPLLKNVPTLYHATWYETICPLGLKLLPDNTVCNHNAGVACYKYRCLPRRDWVPLMLQMKLWKRWRPAIDLVVANSHYVQKQLAEGGIESAEVVWNGVPEVKQRPPLSGPPTITYAGRLVAEKGVDVLIHAFSEIVDRLPQARLLIAGAGPERDALVELIKYLGLDQRASILGQLNSSEMEAAFSGGWVHAVPSVCAESFGLSAAEAMMRGTAVVGSRTGGLMEIISESDTGLLVVPGDTASLRDGLLHILEDRNRAERMGRQARHRARQLMTQKRWISRFLDIYSNLKTQSAVARST